MVLAVFCEVLSTPFVKETPVCGPVCPNPWPTGCFSSTHQEMDISIINAACLTDLT